MYIKSKKIIVKLNNEKISEISNTITSAGCILEPSDQKDIFAIDKNKIIEIFKNKGVIIFRNFNLNKDNIIKFTDLFTSKYANDALRRTTRLGNKNIHDVDPGNKEMPLHSEASYSPSWPEIIWFYCNKAPLNLVTPQSVMDRKFIKILNQKLKNSF